MDIKPAFLALVTGAADAELRRAAAVVSGLAADESPIGCPQPNSRFLGGRRTQTVLHLIPRNVLLFRLYSFQSGRLAVR